MSRATEPVLLLHGQPGAACDWDRVIAALGSRVRTFAIDRPGWDGVSKPCDLECNAEGAIAALDRVGAASATIVGYSLGGAVAAWLAASSPARVSRLVLIAPAANAQSLVPLDHIVAAPVVGELASAVALMVGALLWRRLPTVSMWESFVAEQRMLIRELPRLEPLLGRIKAPTTIVIGSADRMVPRSSARTLAQQIPGAKLVQIDHANHLLPWRHPERLAQIIAA